MRAWRPEELRVLHRDDAGYTQAVWASDIQGRREFMAAVPGKAAYRDPDAIAGGTWEAFERVLQRAGYFKGGLRKIELARELGTQIEPAHNRSRSFQVLRNLVLEVGL